MKISKQPTTQLLTFKREINVLDPDSFCPHLDEVVEALPKINRFNGHTIRPYSVAAHSIMCCIAANKIYGVDKTHLLLAILLHDSAETYIGDIVRPIKHTFHEGLADCEEKILGKIFALLDFDEEQDAEINSEGFATFVKELDTRMALTEIEQLMPGVTTKIGDHKSFNMPLLNVDSWEAERHLFHSYIVALHAGRIPKLRKEHTSKHSFMVLGDFNA